MLPRWIRGWSEYTWAFLLHWNPWRGEGLCLLRKKKDFWKVPDMMSTCCKSRLTSGRHLSISFLRSLLPHVNMYVFVAACLNRSSSFSCVSDLHIKKTQCFCDFFSSYLSMHVCSLPVCTIHCDDNGQVSTAKICIYFCMYLVNRWLHLPCAFCEALCCKLFVHVTLCARPPPTGSEMHMQASTGFVFLQTINVAICYCSTTLKRAWLKKTEHWATANLMNTNICMS